MIQTATEQKPKIAYSVKEASAETSLSVPHLRNEIRDKNLRVVRRGRRILIMRDDLFAYLQKGYENE